MKGAHVTNRLLILAILSLALSAPTLGQTPPERERGFKADLLYQLQDFDSVNLFNGNLNLSIPLAAYPVSADVSYAFALRYAGNVWENHERCHQRLQSDQCSAVWRLQRDNAGVGWRFSFGELQDLRTSFYGAGTGTGWQYVSPDGGEHNFYPTLHEPACSSTITTDCDSVTTDVWYTRDGTYLRLKKVDGAMVVEFPDGQRHRFTIEPITNQWRLAYIYGQASLPASGVPTTNYVKFSYTAHATEATIVNWEITDSHGRTHTVAFRKGAHVQNGIVDTIDLAAPGGTTTRYDLIYDEYTASNDTTADGVEATSLVNPYNTSPAVAGNMLRRVGLPSGERWSFDYKVPVTGPDPTSGTLETATLPTLGKINWRYQQYKFSTPSGESAASGVAERWLGEAGAKMQYTRYTVSGGTVTVETLAPNGTAWNPESKVVNYFTTAWGSHFGLPYTTATNTNDGTTTARNLSTEIFDCDPAKNTCSATPDRRQYVKYEMDDVGLGVTCHVDYPCARDGNRRVASDRTLYITDANRYADTNRSDFDGLGHYRKVATDGNFAGGNVRETYTGFNADTRGYDSSTRIGQSVGTYALTSTGKRSNGFTMLLHTDAWNLNTYTTSHVKESGATAYTESCFDPLTGFLQRVRTNALDGGGPGPADLLVVYTRDASSGYASREERFGGDRQAIDSTSYHLCTTATPAHDQYSFRIDYATQYGVLRSKRFVNGATGTAVGFHSVDHAAIDRNSGLVTRSNDAAGLATTYEYDSARRLKSVRPAGVAATEYTYTNASGSTPASVKASAGSGTNRAEQIWEFDPFGRMSVEKRLMPGGGWSGRKTTYDSAGRRASVSEQETVGTPFIPVNTTRYSDYDPFGRVGSVTTPDSKTAFFTYAGERLTTRTSEVALSAGDTRVAVTEERDRAGRLINVVEDAQNTKATTTYAYDVGNRLAKVTMTSGQNTQTRLFDYDHRGLLASESHPESGQTSYQYDALGNTVQKTTPAGTLTYTYDRAARVTALAHDGSTVKSFSYDRANTATDFSMGKLATATRHNRTPELGDVEVTETYAYAGAGGRLSRKETVVTTRGSAPETYTFSEAYTYNALGDVSTLEYPGCTTGCSSLVAPARTITNTYRHAMLSDIAPYTRATSTSSGITYHPNGAVATIRHQNADGTEGPVYEQTVAHGMARPSSISVSNFCDSANLSITAQPASRTTTSGSPAGLTVTAPGAISYQWYRVNGTAAPEPVGDNSATLSIAVTASAEFFVRVANGACTLDSEPATVTVTSCTPPDATITAPSSIAATTTGTALVAAAAGATYQWTISGGTITSGAGTRQITFEAGCSGSVTLGVTVTAACAATASHVVAIVSDTPPAPTALSATAVSPTQVHLSWSFSGTAQRFQIHRGGVRIGSTTGNTYVDTTAQPSTAYVYTVTAVDTCGNDSAATAGDLATTVMFADHPVVAGVTPPRAVHLTELQTAVNAVRAAAGLAPAAFSAIGSSAIAAAHIEELRSALDPARSALALAPAVYTRRPVASGQLVRAYDVNDTRGGVQ